MGGACIVVWQYSSPVTNTPIMLLGLFLAGSGFAASAVASFNPTFFSKSTPEKTLLARLVSIEEAGGEYTLLFQDTQGKTYSFIPSGIPDVEENSACTLTVKGGEVQHFAPLSARRLD